MKQEKFINTLKKVINEEVRSVIKQELTEILTNGLQSSIDELKESKKIESKQTNIKSVTNNKVKFQKNKFSDPTSIFWFSWVLCLFLHTYR